MKKIVLKLELRDGDEKGKQKVMITASALSGVDSVAMDMKDKKLTITGDIDPVKVVGKLRKICQTEIVTVGPQENKKKDDGGAAKKDEKKPAAAAGATVLPLPQYYYPPPNFQNHPYMVMNHTYPRYASEDQETNSCVIS